MRAVPTDELASPTWEVTDADVIKSKYPEEYSNVDKKEREKLLARKSCFE